MTVKADEPRALGRVLKDFTLSAPAGRCHA